jgi:tripartite-type tricarboxylate transporter receptor subunit TctC
MNVTVQRRGVLAAGLSALAAPAFAQGAFPQRPIRMIVPWLPGTPSDVNLRTMAEISSRRLGQPMLVENRTGATGTLGLQLMAAEARGDGHLIGQMPITGFRLPAMSRRAMFDPINDFTYIIHITGFTFGLVVRSDSPWQTLEEFLEHARRNPGRVTYGTPGVGSTLHIGMEMIAAQSGVEFTHVPFRGGADTTQALLAGQITSVADATSWAPMVEDGRFRLLVAWGAERIRRFPQVRTLREAGFDMVFDSPFGLVGPKNMDPGVVRVLHDALREAVFDPAHLAVLERHDMPLRYMNSADYLEFARRLNAQEIAAVRRLNLSVDG